MVKKRIVYISKYGAYPPYGMESRQIYLSRELVKRGYEVHVFLSTANHQLARTASPGTHTIDGVQINWVKTSSYKKPYGLGRLWSWLSFEFQLRKELRKRNFMKLDMVIVSSLSLFSIINGVFLKNKYQARMVLEIRDIWPLILKDIANISVYNPIYWLLSKIEKHGYTNADLVIGTMPNLKEHVSNTIDSDIATIQIPHLMNELLVHANSHSHSEKLIQIRKQGYTTCLAYSGNISKSAGLQYLLDGAQMLAELNVAIVILGKGPLKSAYMKKYTDKNIYFLDKIPQNEVVSFLKDCDILYDGYLKSEIYKYGSSRNKYVEYCLAAKPMLISYEGYPLFIEKHECGLIVDSQDSMAIEQGINRILKLPKEERVILGKRARSYAKEHLQIATHIDKLAYYLKVFFVIEGIILSN